MRTDSQNAKILAHLKAGGSITFWEAAEEFGVMHLPRRIKDLKESGHDISDTWVRLDEKRFKRYRMAP